MPNEQTDAQVDDKALEVLQYFAAGFVKSQRVILTAAGTVELQRCTQLDGKRAEEAFAHLHNRLTRLHFLELERESERKAAAEAAKTEQCDAKRTHESPKTANEDAADVFARQLREAEQELATKPVETGGTPKPIKVDLKAEARAYERARAKG